MFDIPVDVLYRIQVRKDNISPRDVEIVKDALQECNIIDNKGPFIQRVYDSVVVYAGKFDYNKVYLAYFSKNEELLKRVFTSNKKLNKSIEGVFRKCCYGMFSNKHYLIYTLNNSNVVPLSDFLIGKYDFFGNSTTSVANVSSMLQNSLIQLVLNLVKGGMICELAVQDILWIRNKVMILMNNSRVRRSSKPFVPFNLESTWQFKYMLYTLSLSANSTMSLPNSQSHHVLMELRLFLQNYVSNLSQSELNQFATKYEQLGLIPTEQIQCGGTTPVAASDGLTSSFLDGLFPVDKSEPKAPSPIAPSVPSEPVKKPVPKVNEYGSRNSLRGTYKTEKSDKSFSLNDIDEKSAGYIVPVGLPLLERP